jgi:hypothetical protein
MTTRTLGWTASAGCVLALSACSASFHFSTGGSSLSASEVEGLAKTALASKAPEPIKSVMCPSSLDAKVGASESCTITLAGGAMFPVTATVAKTSGGRADVHFVVGNQLGAGTSTGRETSTGGNTSTGGETSTGGNTSTGGETSTGGDTSTGG